MSEIIDQPNQQNLRPQNEREWRLFERHFSRWLSDNAHSLTAEEGKSFKKASFICLGSGISTTVAMNVLLSRFNLIQNRVTRRLFSAFTGLYAFTYTINRLRRDIYTELLSMHGSAGVASRKILTSVREMLNSNPSNVSDLYLANPTPDKRVSHEDNTNATYEDNSWLKNDGSYKTWEDIRSNNQDFK